MSKTDRDRPRWNDHFTKIALSAAYVVVPMVVFTIAILVIIFSNLLDLDHCPQSELCPLIDKPGLAVSSDYYINFSVGRLAFVSSLSSTISYALVAAMMTMYGYVVAGQLLHASDTSNRQAVLPTPRGVSTLIRLLNAEMLLMWDLLMSHCRKMLRFQQRSIYRRHTREPRLLRLCRIVFLLGLLAR